MIKSFIVKSSYAEMYVTENRPTVHYNHLFPKCQVFVAKKRRFAIDSYLRAGYTATEESGCGETSLSEIKERNDRMITFTMNADKSFVKSGEDTLFGQEVSASRFHIVLPKICDGQNLQDCQKRLCFAMGQAGDIAILQDPIETDAASNTYLYIVGGALTSQAGEYQVWVEFWENGKTPYDPPAFCLKSAAATVKILPHPRSEQLLSRAQLTVFAQVQEQIESDLESAQDAKELAQISADASLDAQANAETAQARAQTAAQTAQNCATTCQSLMQSAQGSSDSAANHANQAQTSAQSASESAAEAAQSATDAAKSSQAAKADAKGSADSASASAKSAEDAAEQAQNAKAHADRANVQKQVYIRYSANADGSNFSAMQRAGYTYVGFAFAESAPQNASDYEWFQFSDLNAVAQGTNELRLKNGARIVSGTDGSVIIQHGAQDSNYAGHSYSFSVGVLNYNGGYAAVVTGYKNRTTQSQQFVAGQGNTAPVSRNLAVVGEYCDSRILDRNGKLNTNWSRPLFLVGNGESGNVSNAFAVYKNGEAVLHMGDTYLPIGETVGAHHQLLQMLVQNAGMEGYSTLTQRIDSRELYSAEKDALPYGMIAKLRAWSTPEGGELKDAKQLYLRYYDETGGLQKEDAAPIFLQSLTDFGHGISESDCNEVDLLNQTYTRHCGVYTFTGNEILIADAPYDGTHYKMVLPAAYDNTGADDNFALWNFGRVESGYPTYYLGTGASFGLGMYRGSDSTQKWVYFYSDQLDLNGIKSYLKSRYDSGTPIRLVYRLPTPIAEEIPDTASLQAWYVQLHRYPQLRVGALSNKGSNVYSASMQLQYQIKNG